MLFFTKRYNRGPIVRFSASVEFVMTRTLVIYPVWLRSCSRIHNERTRMSKPWYMLAFLLGEDLKIKKDERINPWTIPIKIKTDIALSCVVVFIIQI
jgi:hypothetical protein